MPRATTANPAAKAAIYQIKITLSYIRPPIWRRVLVPADISLRDLHVVIQIAMGWMNSHLHAFKVGSTIYSDDDDEYGLGYKPETVKLNRLLRSEKSKLTYKYDFGDDWSHEVILEARLPREPSIEYPLCVKGKRACPPEDCGGPWCYPSMLQVLADPEHEEYEETREWIGEFFNSETLDIEAVNESLHDDEFKAQFYAEDENEDEDA